MRSRTSNGLRGPALAIMALAASVCAAVAVQAAQAQPAPSLGIEGGKSKRPQIATFSPSAGPSGTTVTVNGSNFNGAKAVTFNGSNASFAVISASQLTAAVPANATSGPIAVTNAAGTATSGTSFTVNSGTPPPPTITSFSPTSGQAGTVVKIAGTNFTGAAGVTFNGSSAAYTVDSGKQISATVPAAAATGPIAVTTPGGTAASTSVFTTTPQTDAFFVAPNGSDSTGDGSISKPFATLAKAETAMQAGSTKTTYIRSGYYALPSVVESGVSYGLHLTSADSGETWSSYPADGYNSAVLDGGSTSASTGIQELIAIDGASNVTINGLQLQHFRWIGVGIHGGGSFYQLFPTGTGTADGNTITNNLIHDGSYDLNPVFGYGGGGVYGEGKIPNTTVTNNAVYNISAFGVEAQTGNAGQGGTIDSLVIASNAVLSTCQLENDCGAVYVQDKNTTSTGITIDNNFVRDAGYAAYPARPIYVDDGVSGATVTHNVVAAGLYIWAFTIHGGKNNTLSSNIVDLGPGNNREILLYEGDGLTDMKGNVLSNNVIVSGGGGGGYEGRSFKAQPTIANNAYHQYTGKAVYAGGYTGLDGDSAPAPQDPQLTCWAYNVARGSSVYSAPVSFDQVPQGWGPPGFTIPKTGTPPSQPHDC